MVILKVVLATMISAAPMPADTTRAPQPDEYAFVEAAARQLQDAVAADGWRAVARRTDVEALQRRIFAAGDFQEDIRREIRRDIRGGEAFAFLETDVGDTGTLTFLRVVAVDGEPRALMRSVSPEFAITYFEVLFSPGAKGMARISDMRPAMVGRDITTFLATFFEHLWSPHTDSASVRVSRYLAAMAGLAEDPRPEDFVFPEEHASGVVGNMIHLIHIASRDTEAVNRDQRAVEALGAAVDAFERVAPDHPSLLLRRIDLALMRGEVQTAMELIDRMEAAYDDPAGAALMRAHVMAELGDLAAAAEHAWVGLALEPELPRVAHFVLGAAIQLNDFDAIVRSFEHFETHLGAELDLEAMAEAEEFGAFRESDAFRVWAASR